MDTLRKQGYIFRQEDDYSTFLIYKDYENWSRVIEIDSKKVELWTSLLSRIYC